MGPEPNWKRKMAEMTVVKLESKMVTKAFLKPSSIADFTDLPARRSSLILSKMRTLASTAIPMLKIRPAMPGRVRVARK